MLISATKIIETLTQKGFEVLDLSFNLLDEPRIELLGRDPGRRAVSISLTTVDRTDAEVIAVALREMEMQPVC